jgi:tRNA A-37 threonylcarbamoyl transferase component Bud32
MLPEKSKAEFEALIQGAEILEKDRRGVKVLHLTEDRIIKLFRRNHSLSSQLWAPHAWRFKRNAMILRKRGIQTISVESIFNVPEIKRQAVVYHALPGITLRQFLRDHEGKDCRAKIEKFGQFVAKLHKQGIRFRSMHLGNVLVTTKGELALIDIVDMNFRWFGPLFNFQRLRNFHHIARYEEDKLLLSKTGKDTFIRAYLNAANLPKSVKSEFIKGCPTQCPHSKPQKHV